MSKPPVPKVKPKDSPLSPVNSDPSRYEIDQMLVRHEQKEQASYLRKLRIHYPLPIVIYRVYSYRIYN